MGRYLDPYSQGKQDWMNYVQKRQQIKDERKADEEHNQNIVDKKLEKQEQAKPEDKKDQK